LCPKNKTDRRARVTARRVATPSAVATGPAASKTAAASERTVLQLFRRPFLSPEATATLLRKANGKPGVDGGIESIETEQCFNVETTSPLTNDELETLQWLLRETFEPDQFSDTSTFSDQNSVVEVGPRLAFQSAWSTNAVGVCLNCGLGKVTRLERSRRFKLTLTKGTAMSDTLKLAFAQNVHDRMTECVYDEPLATFVTNAVPEPTYTIPVLAEGRAALERVDKEMGLAFDEEDFEFYLTLFRDDIGRDPTNVELFDMGQSNSEHSRHWFFGGNLIVDGVPQPKSLFRMVKDTITGERGHNSVIAFKDNSSAIRGYVNTPLRPVRAGGPSKLEPRAVDLDLLLTGTYLRFPNPGTRCLPIGRTYTVLPKLVTVCPYIAQYNTDTFLSQSQRRRTTSRQAWRRTRAQRPGRAAACGTRTPLAPVRCSPRVPRGTALVTFKWKVTTWVSNWKRQ
jgi:phosphoribosylformylglycinamidine synthase|tara:strand:- start:1698 stop:3059 length:1362 start_codon:yes stop_codon:yes gene_type:complete